VPDRILRGADPVTCYGSFYLILVPMSIFMIIYDEMIREKMNNLRFGLLVMGCSNAAFWISWVITGVLFSAFMAVLMEATGVMFGFDLFMNSPFYVIFIFLFAISMAHIAMAACLTTLMSSQAMAYTVSYTMLLCSVIITMALADAIIVYKIFFNIDMPEWVDYIKFFFNLLPGFHLSKLYGDIVRVTCMHFRPDTLVWVPGRDFVYDDLFTVKSGSFLTKDRYIVPSMFSTLQQVFGLTCLYFGLAWYFDNVLQSNRGHAEPFYFFLKPTYWLRGTFKKIIKEKPIVKSRKGSINVGEHTHDTAREEKMNVQELEAASMPCKGVRVLGLSKTYERPMCSSTQKEDIQALKNLFLEIQEGELLGVMGHNGAGKTTLINVLSGLVNLTSGKARIYDAEISTDLDMIRKRMGIVSQFDVLWDQLTGFEHMYLFAEIKRVRSSKFEHVAKKRLKDVGLLDAGHLQVGKYSGGMRRRMSVALSSVGDPCIILMDEPTTGMDPVSRRQVWDLIQRLKKKRVVIMTTHAMEEAELLSDKLAVLVEGRLRCVGTPLQLKNLYGDGYRVSIMCSTAKINSVISLMQQIVPSAKLIDESGGALIFNVPLAKVKQLGPIFKLIEKKEKSELSEKEQQEQMTDRKRLLELQKLVKDVGVS